jgi:hypothetical protein
MTWYGFTGRGANTIFSKMLGSESEFCEWIQLYTIARKSHSVYERREALLYLNLTAASSTARLLLRIGDIETQARGSRHRPCTAVN